MKKIIQKIASFTGAKYNTVRRKKYSPNPTQKKELELMGLGIQSLEDKKNPLVWVIIEGSYFEDMQRRAYPLQSTKTQLFVEGEDGIKIFFTDLPRHLWTIEHRANYVGDGEIFL